MITWVLILYVFAGPMSKYEAVTLTSVPGFASQRECQQAGTAASNSFSGGYRDARFVCVSQAGVK